MYKNRQLMRLNKVLHKSVVKEVDCIAVGHVSFIEDIPKRNGAKGYGEWVDLDEVEFIPLTEGWLLKCGFKENVIGVFTMGFLDMERLLLDSPEWEICINEEQTGYTIRYVHQLQNLYFALTGKELTIKN